MMDFGICQKFIFLSIAKINASFEKKNSWQNLTEWFATSWHESSVIQNWLLKSCEKLRWQLNCVFSSRFLLLSGHWILLKLYWTENRSNRLVQFSRWMNYVWSYGSITEDKINCSNFDCWNYKIKNKGYTYPTAWRGTTHEEAYWMC